MEELGSRETIQWYERDFTLEDAMGMIQGSMKSAVRNYVAVGFYLKAIRDRKLFEEAGYRNFEEFVRDKYDKDKGWASKCIKVNDRLSKDGNSPLLADEYKDYNVSQLVELAAMTEEQRAQVTPETSVREMKQIRNPKPEEPEKVVTLQLPEKTIEHFTDGDRSIDNAYGATISKIVKSYLGKGLVQECMVTMWGDTYKVLRRPDVTVFYTDKGETLFDVENSRLEKEYQYWYGSKSVVDQEQEDSLVQEAGAAISQQQDKQMISAPSQRPITEKAEDREAYVHEQFRLQEEYLYSFAKRVIRENKGWFMEDYMGRVANVNTSEPLLKELLGANDEGRQYNIDLEDKTVVLCLFKDRIDVHYFDSNEMLHTDGACEWFYFAAAVQAMWNEVTLKDARERAIGEKLVGAVEKEESDEAGSVAISQQESQAEEKPAVIDAEFTEINDPQDKDPTDLEIARQELERANNLLNQCLECKLDETDIDIRRMKVKVAALVSLVHDLDDVENPPPKQGQPELPILRNNDQRAAFVDAYETWPLWIETKETDERYYRYDLSDGTSMVVKVYHAMLFDYSITGLNYEERFSEGYGRNEYYILQQGKFFKDCEANRSALIEKLKEIQKKG